MFDHRRRLRTIVVIWLIATALATASASGESIVVNVSVGFLFDVDPRDEVEVMAARPADGSQIVHRIRRPGEIALELDNLEDGWHITCRGAQYWCSKESIAGTESVSLQVFRATELSGRVMDADRLESPSILIEGWVRYGPDLPPAASFVDTAQLEPGGQFHFLAPVSFLDLRFASEGRVPQYRWGLDPAFPRDDIGTLHLVPGGSIAGFVIDGVTDLPVGGAEVMLIPDHEEDNDALRDRLRSLAHTSRTGDRGFFQVTAASPGLYRLEVVKSSRAPEIVRGIQVLADHETLLRGPIVLRPPLTLVVDLQPSEHPDGSPWQVELAHERGEPPEAQLDEETGALFFPRLEPGLYKFSVKDTEGFRWLYEELRLDKDEVIYRELPIVRVRGEVTLHDEPMAASVSLETGATDRTALTADELGKFSGWIRKPEKKILFATVIASDSNFSRLITIENPRIRDGVLELELNLSGRDIEGTVVDESGRTVSGAKITASQGASMEAAESFTTADGTFLLAALEEGVYDIEVRHRSKGDARVTLLVDRNRDVQHQHLVLRRRQTLRGQILTSMGDPVTGADVEVLTVGPRSTNATQPTDLEGRFSIRVGAGSTHAVFRVYAPSQVLWSGCLTLDLQQAMTITLPPPPGVELSIEIISDPERPPLLTGTPVLLTADNGFLTHSSVHRWNRMLGEPMAFPRDGAVEILTLRQLARSSYAVTLSPDSPTNIAASLCTIGASQDLDWKMSTPLVPTLHRLDLVELLAD